MKIGDKVRVVKLVHDDACTNLELGVIGVIKEINETGNVLDIDFHETFPFCGTNASCNSDGTYQMYNHQLEVVEEQEDVQ
jgi:hypothetical protein